MIKGINHVGIVVKDIDEVVAFLQETFGAEEISRIDYPEIKQISALVKIGDGYFELMQPTAPDGVVGQFLQTKGGGLHHVSLICEDIVGFCEKIEGRGLKVIGKNFDGPIKTAFVHPKSGKGILFELAEKMAGDAHRS
jgi:methylmalonyl-CoA/ethylmalonyl-CoA epimerase